MSYRDVIVRQTVIEALEQIDPRWRAAEAAKRTVPEALADLKNETAGLRRVSAIVLEKIGLGAQEAVSALIVALPDSDVNVRQAVAEALEQIDPHWATSEVAKQTVTPAASSMHEAQQYLRHALTAARQAATLSKAITALEQAMALDPALRSEYAGLLRQWKMGIVM